MSPETRSKAGRQQRAEAQPAGPNQRKPAAKKKQRAQLRAKSTAPPIVTPNAFSMLSNHGDSLPSTPPEAKPDVAAVDKPAEADDDSISQFGDNESELSYIDVEEGECTPPKSVATDATSDEDLADSDGDRPDETEPPEQGTATQASQSAQEPATPEATPPTARPRLLGQSIMEARRVLLEALQSRQGTAATSGGGVRAEGKENAPKRNLTLRGHDPRSRRGPATSERLPGTNSAESHEHASLLLTPPAPVDPRPVEFLPPLIVPPFRPTSAAPPARPSRPNTPRPLPDRVSGMTATTTKTRTPRLTAEEIKRARLPVGAPTLLTTAAGTKRPDASRIDRSPNGRSIQRDSEAPHKRPRLHGAGPTREAVSSRPTPRNLGVISEVEDADSPLHLLADAAARMSSERPEARTDRGARAATPAASLRADTTRREAVRLGGPRSEARGSEDTLQTDSREDTVIPEIQQASIAAYVASDTATLTTSNEPANNFAPTPPSGFPDQQGSGPGWQLANQTKENLAGWVGIEGGKVLAVPFGQGANDHKLADRLFSTVAHVHSVVSKFLGVSTVHVSPPIAEHPVTDLNQAPYAYLVHGISIGRAAQLIVQKCISSPNVTVMFYPFALSLPSLFVCFGHIIDCGCDMVRNMAIATMTRGPNFAAIIELLRETPGLPSTMDFVELARRLVNTVRISRSEKHGKGASLTPVYSLYMSTSIMTADTWKQWHQLLHGFVWYDIFLAEVVVRTDVECEGCHGRDHYQFACPFMQVPGWHGVMPPPRRRAPATGPAGARTAPPATAQADQGQRAQHSIQRPTKPLKTNPRNFANK
ncbi:hypothetical protein PsYK624_146410 [Phanerochaete sordida]|uniref:Uncharacterized protein n=1 Tax=Phanerochaete sordida TaxID=48140 RepID=A0A9P3LKD6_9APHY|nr:hypothetical protein PsYK624_146410 [Phanerochaete sordida]